MHNFLIYDPEQKLSLEGIRCASQDDFLRKLREKADFSLGLIVPGGAETLSLHQFLRVISHRAPLLPIMLIGTSDNSLHHLVDVIFPQIPSVKALNTEIEALLKRRKVMSECQLIGRSESLAVIADTIVRIADSDLTVLITGESGTGKELVAQGIHNHSHRKNKLFLPINCSAIPETLLESQLFGHKKGSFTGAHKDFSGFFAQAEGGTLFLDEIGEIPPAVQVKLLRVLEAGQYFPVGSSEAHFADVRIVAATNRDLQISMQQGFFREDLYYRIGGVRIFIPPLRERPEDISILASYFAQIFSSKHNYSFGGFSDDALDAMINYHWPGNARELRNLVEAAVTLSSGSVIRGTDLSQYFAEHRLLGRQLPILRTDTTANIEGILTPILALLRQNNAMLNEILEHLKQPSSFGMAERDIIAEVLRKNAGSRKKAANALGISVRTLYRKMKRYGLK